MMFVDCRDEFGPIPSEVGNLPSRPWSRNLSDLISVNHTQSRNNKTSGL